MSKSQIYVAYSEEVRGALAATDKDFLEAVRAELSGSGVQGTVNWTGNPTQPEKKDRDLVLLILAAAGSISLVGGAVARVIDALTKRKAAVMEEKHLEAAVGGDGKPIMDAAGNPVYNLTTKPVSFPTSGSTDISVDAIKLIKIGFKTT